MPQALSAPNVIDGNPNRSCDVVASDSDDSDDIGDEEADDDDGTDDEQDEHENGDNDVREIACDSDEGFENTSSKRARLASASAPKTSGLKFDSDSDSGDHAERTPSDREQQQQQLEQLHSHRSPRLSRRSCQSDRERSRRERALALLKRPSSLSAGALLVLAPPVWTLLPPCLAHNEVITIQLRFLVNSDSSPDTGAGARALTAGTGTEKIASLRQVHQSEQITFGASDCASVWPGAYMSDAALDLAFALVQARAPQPPSLASLAALAAAKPAATAATAAGENAPPATATVTVGGVAVGSGTLRAVRALPYGAPVQSSVVYSSLFVPSLRPNAPQQAQLKRDREAELAHAYESVRHMLTAFGPLGQNQAQQWQDSAGVSGSASAAAANEAGLCDSHSHSRIFADPLPSLQSQMQALLRPQPARSSQNCLDNFSDCDDDDDTDSNNSMASRSHNSHGQKRGGPSSLSAHPGAMDGDGSESECGHESDCVRERMSELEEQSEEDDDDEYYSRNSYIVANYKMVTALTAAAHGRDGSSSISSSSSGSSTEYSSTGSDHQTSVSDGMNSGRSNLAGAVHATFRNSSGSKSAKSAAKISSTTASTNDTTNSFSNDLALAALPTHAEAVTYWRMATEGRLNLSPHCEILRPLRADAWVPPHVDENTPAPQPATASGAATAGGSARAHPPLMTAPGLWRVGIPTAVHHSSHSTTSALVAPALAAAATAAASAPVASVAAAAPAVNDDDRDLDAEDEFDALRPSQATSVSGRIGGGGGGGIIAGMWPRQPLDWYADPATDYVRGVGTSKYSGQYLRAPQVPRTLNDSLFAPLRVTNSPDISSSHLFTDNVNVIPIYSSNNNSSDSLYAQLRTQLRLHSQPQSEARSHRHERPYPQSPWGFVTASSAAALPVLPPHAWAGTYTRYHPLTPPPYRRAQHGAAQSALYRAIRNAQDK